MKIENFSFGTIDIDGTTYDHDVVIDRGKVTKRKKKPSKALRGEYGHTPLTVREDLPWKCKRLIVGTGANGSLPVTKEVEAEAKERNIVLIELPTAEAISLLNVLDDETNAVLHVTC
jgi:hypothetical protein